MLLKLENKLSTKTTSSQPQLMRPDSRSTTNEGLIHGSLRTPLCNRRKSPESKCEPDFILFCRPSGKWQVFGGFKKHSLCCCLTLAVKANRTFSSHTSEPPVTRTEGRVTSVPLPAGFTKPQIFYWLQGRLFCHSFPEPIMRFLNLLFCPKSSSVFCDAEQKTAQQHIISGAITV